MQPAGAERRPGFFFRRLATPEEFRAVEAVQRDAWGLATESAVPAPILRAFQDNGGLLLGAFGPEGLVGFTMGFLGREGATTFHYSHMTAVRPAFQNRHLGFELKVFQREEVLAQGLEEIRWTFDPLQSKNAMLNVRRLGGSPDRYLPHYYGAMGDALNEGLESDRLRLVWAISSPRVRDRLTSGPPDPARDVARYRDSFHLCETALRPSGVRVPVRARSPEGPRLNLEIPFDLARIRTVDPGMARRWRSATREAFLSAFQSGYYVEDFATFHLEGETRSVYFLRQVEEDRGD